MIKFPYGAHYFPSAPSIEIRLGLPAGALRLEPISALVDTGADLCIVPSVYLEQLGAEVDDHQFIRSPWRQRVSVDIYLLDVGIGQNRLPSIQVIGDEQGTEIIVGRNLLNKLNVNWDGPQQSLEIN
jgi:predicted aspartyl protease